MTSRDGVDVPEVDRGVRGIILNDCDMCVYDEEKTAVASEEDVPTSPGWKG